MSRVGSVPVLVGVGQILQREDDPAKALEPLVLMRQALERAGEDSTAPKLLADADAIYVTRGAWGYGDPGRWLADALGAPQAETVGTPFGGNFAQGCVIDAAREIQAGRLRVAVVVGAENGRTVGQAGRAGIELVETPAPGVPDRRVADDKAIFHEAELARGMNSASDIFAIVDSALRHARGESLETQTERVAALWASLSEVAGSNPNAWIREPHDAERIARAGPDNPMISSPYTRLMNANARVDMAAAVVLCAREVAEAAGIPESRRVYPIAATEANDAPFLSTRFELHRSHAIRIAGARVLELAETNIEEVAHLDLYSCFPSSLQIAALELGVPEGRPLSVTGGLTFGGGPLNNATLHAVARMVEVLREDPGSLGLVHGNGGWLAKQAFGVYSTTPPEPGFRYENLQSEIDPLPQREVLLEWTGPVTVEAYTVAHRQGEPRIAFAACLTPDGRRTWGTVSERAALATMLARECCGVAGRIDGAGALQLEMDPA